MYPAMIAEANEIFTKNLRIRSDSVELRAQTNALLLRYRAHRFPHVSGASESASDPKRAATILSKIHSGALPRPAETPEKCWVGKGTSRPCHGCGVAIRPDELEYELDIADGTTLRFDATCLAVWHKMGEAAMANQTRSISGLRSQSGG